MQTDYLSMAGNSLGYRILFTVVSARVIHL